MKAGPRARRAVRARELDPGPIVSLLLFEAAECLMALLVSEVTRLVAMPAGGGSADEASLSGETVDMDDYFTGRPSAGPWLRWSRQEQSVWLRITRVVEVVPCAIRALAPMPAALRGTRGAGAFWAAGVRGEEVFLLVDPARFADTREG